MSSHRTKTDEPIAAAAGSEAASNGPDAADTGRAGQSGTLGVRRDPHAGEAADAAQGELAQRRGVRSRFKPGGLKPVRKAAGAPRAQPEPVAAVRAPTVRAIVDKSARDDAVKREVRRREPVRTAKQPARRSAAEPETRSRSRDAAAGAVPVQARTHADSEGVRLSKIMAERGLCSRREADQIIERGWVYVDGKRISELGTRIDPGAEIWLAPEAAQRQATQVTILLHKPVGYVSGQPEPGFEPAVKLIGADNQFDREVAQRFHPSHLRGLAPAGRLDIDSTGLLVLTQNGRIARQLIGDDSKVDKEYIVRVEGDLSAAGLALLNHGLELDGRKLRQARVEWINSDQLRFVLREGRKRQIRRMCELVGLRVAGLKRTRIGQVKLGNLPLGEWRYLRPDESF